MMGRSRVGMNGWSERASERDSSSAGGRGRVIVPLPQRLPTIAAVTCMEMNGIGSNAWLAS